MTDEDDILRAQLALDGELDAQAQLAFERELAERPELAAIYARHARLREALREHTPREAAPVRLRARLEKLGASAPPRRPWLGAALAAGLAGFAALAGFEAGRAGRNDPALAALVSGHERAVLSGQPFDVASSDRHTVKPWLAARAPLGAFVPDLGVDGFALIGGRLEILDGRPVPTVVYRRREHLISVAELPLSQAGAGAAVVEGYHVARWRDDERAYVAISDLDAGELAIFAESFAKAAGNAKATAP